MKRKDAIKLWNTLNLLSQKDSNKLFKIFIAKNLLKLEKEIELIKQNFSIPGAMEYEEKRKAILFKYADKNEKGEIVFNGTDFTISDPNAVAMAQEELKQLEHENKEIVEEIEKINKEFEVYLEEDFEDANTLTKIKEEFIPDDIDINLIKILLACNLVVED
jgi:tRNA U34 5-carboxymethylaminomethyl modifying enzyme MnmG/GidA